MFRQNAMRMSIRPMDGMSVIVSGQVGLYSEGGSYQITCDSMRPDGIGTLYQQFEALKNRLAAEGLFDEEHKRRLPYRPKKIAVVTSETGAVLHDICMVSRARDPGVPLVLTESNMESFHKAEEGIAGEAAIVPQHMCAKSRCAWKLENVTDAKNNFTRFFMLDDRPAHEQDLTHGESKMALYVVDAADKPGTLFEILKAFAENNINLAALMSRPTKKDMGTYNFYLELELESRQREVLARTIETLKKQFTIKVLGAYTQI